MELTKYQLADRAAFIGLYGRSISKARAARIAGVSRAKVYRMIRDGRLATTETGSVCGRSLWAIKRARKEKAT